MNQNIKLAIEAVYASRGDDFQRAKLAFRGLSKEEMQEQHGESGQTRQEILDGYRAYQDKCDEAIEYLKHLS